MPFTLAHPAAVIPLIRLLQGRAVLSAMVIGSMVPDAANWIPGGIPRAATHSLPSLLWFSLPVGLVAFGLFHAWLKPAWIALLPQSWAERLSPEIAARRLTDFRWFDVAVCTVLAAWTHVALDWIPHVQGPIAKMVPEFRRSIWVEYEGLNVYGIQVVYYLLSLSGLAIVLWAVLTWRFGGPALRDCDDWRSRAGIRSSILIVSAIWAVLQVQGIVAQDPEPWHGLRFAAVQFLIAFVGAVFVSLLAWAAWFHFTDAGEPSES